MKVRIVNMINEEPLKEFTCKRIRIKNHKYTSYGMPSPIPDSYRVEFIGIDGTDRCMSVNLLEYDCLVEELFEE